MEGVWNIGFKQILNIWNSGDYSLEIWKIRRLREGPVTEAWLMKSQRETKTILGLFGKYFCLKNFGIWLAEADLATMTNVRTAPMENHCIAGTKDAGQLGLEHLHWLRRDQHHWNRIFCKVFPLGRHTEARAQRGLRRKLMLAARLGSVRVTHMVLVLEASRGNTE